MTTRKTPFLTELLSAFLVHPTTFLLFYMVALRRFFSWLNVWSNTQALREVLSHGTTV
jgi:hypothetical protein